MHKIKTKYVRNGSLKFIGPRYYDSTNDFIGLYRNDTLTSIWQLRLGDSSISLNNLSEIDNYQIKNDTFIDDSILNNPYAKFKIKTQNQN